MKSSFSVINRIDERYVTHIKSSCRRLCAISIQQDGALPMMLINVY